MPTRFDAHDSTDGRPPSRRPVLMHSAPRLRSENRLLSELPSPEHARLLTRLEQVHLSRGEVLHHVDAPIRHAYFFMNGMASLMACAEGGEMIEVATVNREGMVGIPAVRPNNPSPYQVVVQVPADAMRIEAGWLRDEFSRAGEFQGRLIRYLLTVLSQMTQSAICRQSHTADGRLCRWLLMAREGGESSELRLTHERIAEALGIPRTSVTAGARTLKEMKLIGYSRGKILILDRRSLEITACACYAAGARGAVSSLAA